MPEARTGNDRRALALRGEELAARHLAGCGYRILERNFSCPLGEVDLIARHGKTLVFVEVKTRRGRAFGLPEEAVDRRKQAKIWQVACWYLKRMRGSSPEIRFDVVAVALDGVVPEVRVIQGAFDGEGLPWG